MTVNKSIVTYRVTKELKRCDERLGSVVDDSWRDGEVLSSKQGGASFLPTAKELSRFFMGADSSSAAAMWHEAREHVDLKRV